MNTNKDAIGIWAYRCDILDKTVNTLVKHTPVDIPIYILDQANPCMEEQKNLMRKLEKDYDGRIKVWECFVTDERSHAPLSIIKFLLDHPEIERLLKIDDDFIVASDVYSGCVKAYESEPDTLLSVAMNPINIWGLGVLFERLGVYDKFPKWIYDPVNMYESLKYNNEWIQKIWEKTTPPSMVLKKLRKGERFLEIPKIDRWGGFGMCHYFAHRKDILDVGGIWDERHWKETSYSSGRPRIMDTWSLVYHFAWYPWLKYAIDSILPIVERNEF